jgi:hypothetical protein
MEGREQSVQFLCRACLLHNLGDLGNHLLEFRATVCGKSLRMRFLKEPKLLESDNSVSFGDFEAELEGTLIPVALSIAIVIR